MTNFEKFQSTLIEQYRDLFVHDEEYEYVAKTTTPEALGARMTISLSRGGANKNGAGIKRTCRVLDIPYTYAGISAYLKGESNGHS